MSKTKAAKRTSIPGIPSFDVKKEEAAVIHAIAVRASQAATKLGIKYQVLDADMDLTAVHANGNPLRLNDLLAADDTNFAHDVFGIRRFIDRSTGKLGGFFSPRYSVPQKSGKVA